jgi:3-oxoacyl-[acyl-carrier protein] reductase
MELKDKVAIVTGASTGIGRAIALQLAREGSRVFLAARNEPALRQTQETITSSGGKAEVIIADLSNLESINLLISQVKEKTASIDILVNVAGIWHGKDEVFAGKNFEAFDQKVVLDTFMVGTVTPALLAHAFIPLMEKGSKIINISGTFENGAKGWLPYYVSKRAIEDLTVGLSQELEEKDIQVNAISPSDTATEQYQKYFPQFIEDAISPEEIAKQVVFLCSESANQVNGQVFVMKKGQQPEKKFHF